MSSVKNLVEYESSLKTYRIPTKDPDNNSLILGNIIYPLSAYWGPWTCSQAAGTKLRQAEIWYGYPRCWFASGFHQCERFPKIQDGNFVNQQHQNHILKDLRKGKIS